jgi:threonine/homoserine/homoserine lactone efflux protein
MITMMYGFMLGFMGYLPPGNINLTVVQLSIHHSKNKLWGFMLLVTVMEFIYCLGCLTGLDFLMRQPYLVHILEWSSVFIFAILGLLAFFHNEDASKVQALSGYGRGVFATIVNPLQIPFWLVWGVYLSDKLKGELSATALFALITAGGTVCVLWAYAVGGKKLVEWLKLERKLLDRFIGLLLIGLAIWQLYKVLHGH